MNTRAIRKPRFFRTLGRKFILSFSILAIAILVSTCSLGFYEYKTNVEKVYNAHAYSAARQAASLLDGNLIEKYASTGKKDANYDKIKASIEELRENMGLISVFIVQVNNPSVGNYYYIIDTYQEHDYENDLGTVTEYPAASKKQIEAVYYQGADLSHTYITVNSKTYGQNFFAIVPIYNKNNEIVANLFVQTSIEQVNATLRQYLLTATGITVVLVVMLLALFLAYINHKIVNPIRKITKHATSFISKSSIADPLEKIRTGDEIEQLADSIIQMEKNIHLYTENLAAATASREYITAELNVSKQIQRNLFPYHFPAFPDRKDFDIYAFCQPCDAIAGNFYNFFLVDDRHLCLYIGDASSTGIPTLIFSVIATTLMGNYASLHLTADRILANVNNQLSRNNEAELTIDVFLAIVDTVTGEMSYVTAGTSIHALLKSPGQDFEELPHRNCFPLATIEQVHYPVLRTSLSQGDMLFLYTIGISNAVNEKGMEFGSDYAKETISSLVTKEYSLKILMDRFFHVLNDFEGEAEQTTDSTALIFRYTGN